MLTVEVTGPDGHQWGVWREWFHRPPWWPGVGFSGTRKRRAADQTQPKRSSLDADPTGCVDVGVDSPGTLLIVLAVVIVAVIAWFWILPAAFFAVDLLVVLAIALWGLILRMAFGRPWRVVASQAGSSPSEEYVFLVRGFRASRRARDEIVVQIAAGQTPSRAEPA